MNVYRPLSRPRKIAESGAHFVVLR